jgi:hypothetical protein
MNKARGIAILLAIVLVPVGILLARSSSRSAQGYTTKQASDGLVQSITTPLQAKSLFVANTRCSVALAGKPTPKIKTGTEFACIVGISDVSGPVECDYVTFAYDGVKPTIHGGQKIAGRYCS